MAKARTIDNLGIDVSSRYAADQALIDKDFIIGSKHVGNISEITATSPYVISDFDEQFNTLQKNIPWAKFSPPPNFLSHRKRIFSFQLIPSLGSSEKQETEIEKISKDNERQKKQEMMDINELQEEKEREKIIKLLKTLGILDKYLTTINSKRGQYHKG